MSENIMEVSDFLLKEQDQQQEGVEGVEKEEILDLPLPDKNTQKFKYKNTPVCTISKIRTSIVMM